MVYIIGTLLLMYLSELHLTFLISSTVRLYQQQRQVDVTVGYQSCFVPCAVQSNSNKSLVNSPYVSWERKELRYYQFRPLRQAQYWYANHGLLFQRIPTYCTERPNSNGVYDCDLVISPCGVRYGGLYRCSVFDFDGDNQLTHNVPLDLGGLRDSYEDCTTPDVILHATLVADTVGSFSVNFSWAFAAVEENETICRLILSVRSFTSSVPYDFEDELAPLNGRFLSQKYTTVRDSSFHVFPGVNRARYHQFELRIQASVGTTSAETFNHYSYVYYFSYQSPAAIIEPSQPHTVIRATVGDDIQITCRGTGTPSPTVLLLREIASLPPQSCPGCPVVKGNKFSPVGLNDAGEYYCVAANTLVSPFVTTKLCEGRIVKT